MQLPGRGIAWQRWEIIKKINKFSHPNKVQSYPKGDCNSFIANKKIKQKLGLSSWERARWKRFYSFCTKTKWKRVKRTERLTSEFWRKCLQRGVSMVIGSSNFKLKGIAPESRTWWSGRECPGVIWWSVTTEQLRQVLHREEAPRDLCALICFDFFVICRSNGEKRRESVTLSNTSGFSKVWKRAALQTGEFYSNFARILSQKDKQGAPIRTRVLGWRATTSRSAEHLIGKHTRLPITLLIRRAIAELPFGEAQVTWRYAEGYRISHWSSTVVELLCRLDAVHLHTWPIPESLVKILY